MANPKYKSVAQMIKALDFEEIENYFDTCGDKKIKEMQETIEPKTGLSTIDTLLYMAVSEKSKDDEQLLDKEEEQMKIVNLLIKNGANPNLQAGKDGLTLIMFAVQKNNVSALKSLLNNPDVNVNVKNNSLNTVDEIAVASMAIDCLEELDKRGLIDFNKLHFLSGRTFLHYACNNAPEIDSEKMIEYLISKGVDPTVEDFEGNIASELIPEGEDFEEIFNKVEEYRNSFKQNNSDEFDFSVKL